MPVITAAIADPIQFSGLDAEVSSAIDADVADPIIFYGLPAGVLEPEPTPPTESPTPNGISAKVFNSGGVFKRNLADVTGLRWLDEHNGPGAGSTDLVNNYGLAAGDQILIYVGGVATFRILLDAEPGYRIDDTGQRIDSWAGLGQLGVLNSGAIEPEYGWRDEATEERSFDYGSNPNLANWFVSSEWKTPVGKLVRKSWRWWFKNHRWPKKFPTKNAYWLWWRNPDSKSSVDETCYFVSDPFTLSQARRVKFWVCGDDTLEFQLDGEVRLSTGPGGWKQTSTFVMTLSAGTHYMAAKVSNRPGSTGNQNRSGFLCAVARLDGDGEVARWINRSSPDTWRVRRQGTQPPGWHAAQIVLELAEEQRVRGCAGHSLLSYGFTSAHDAVGVPWTDRLEQSLSVGTVGLDWLQQMVETGLDVAMTPDFRLYLWHQRGVDRTNVRIDQSGDHPAAESASAPPGIRNVLHARATSGWRGIAHSGSVATAGRRETVVSLGSSRSAIQTDRQLAAMLNDLAAPPQTLDVELSGITGHQPYRDFKVSDWIYYKPGGAITWGRYRVMSIAGEVLETGIPKWTVQLYEDPA
jgi:hypothetical protein